MKRTQWGAVGLKVALARHNEAAHSIEGLYFRNLSPCTRAESQRYSPRYFSLKSASEEKGGLVKRKEIVSNKI